MYAKAILAILTSLMLSACGDGSGSSTPQPTEISEEKYLELKASILEQYALLEINSSEREETKLAILGAISIREMNSMGYKIKQLGDLKTKQFLHRLMKDLKRGN